MARAVRGSNQLQTFALFSEFIAEVGVCNTNQFQGSLLGGFAAQLRHAEFSDDVAKHPRFNMHFTPTSASWLNMVERFFRDISENRLRRGVFTSVPELVTAIDEYVAHHNIDPKPFIWTKSARDILQKVIRANSRLSSKQNGTLH